MQPQSRIFPALIALVSLLMMAHITMAEETNPDAKQAAGSANKFAVDLYARVNGEKGNLFFSPYSIETALAMTYAGAKGNTAAEMAQVLHVQGPADKVHDGFADLSGSLNRSGMIGKDKAFDLYIANRLWGQQGFPFFPDFLQLIKSKYDGGMEQVDFLTLPACEQSRLKINDWVAKQTQDKIKDLIAAGILKTDTRLVLTNAIYFKSNWGHQFSKNATHDDAFHLDAAQTLTTPMMHQTSRMRYTENQDLSAVEIPYTFNRLSMIVLLPKKMDGLPALEKSLTADNLDAWLGGLQARQVELSLPKFRFDSHFELADPLSKMGMTAAFTPGKADFGGMTSAQELFIGNVIHKAFIDVNEDGTEAAAATAVVMRAGSAMRPLDKAVFAADHPFLFLIRHNDTGAILFLGRVANPKM